MLYTDYCTVRFAWVEWDTSGEGYIANSELQSRRSFRAARLVDDPERFLFLSFPLHTSRARAVQDFLSTIVEGGLLLEEKRFTFFGVTEPGIKDGWVLLFHEDANWSVERVLKMCGDLEQVFLDHGPGKYAARLGLSFSSTVETIDVPDDRSLKIPDIPASDNTLTTDGCGIIRESAAKDISHQLDVSPQTSAFQIRTRGIKGLLVAYPDRDFDKICLKVNPYSKPSQYMFAYRPSMLKHNGGPTIIEVNKVSATPADARLNYSFIVLLLTLGVELKSIQKLLEQQIQNIKAICHDRQRALTHIHGDFDAKESGYCQEVFEMLQAGHDMDEPYLQSLIRRYQNKLYSSLLSKLLINIPSACYLFGVVDELGVLRDNEVYVNLPATAGVLVGRVLVARNPSYLPSDLRVLEAVDCPRLAFIRDCIVFPRKCKTSIPNLMAGGDLDGDKYFVCWDQTIIPPSTAIQEPDSYADLPSVTRTPCGVTRYTVMRTRKDLAYELVQAFVQLHFSGLLGRAANEWRCVVERSPRLANAEYPKELARIVAVALDLTKTGADYRMLDRHFGELKARYRPIVDERYPSPIDALREQVQVPMNDAHRPRNCRIDPALKIRRGHKAAWDEFRRDGQHLIEVFNRKLRDTINEEGKERDIGKPYRQNNTGEQRERLVDKIREEFRMKYFHPSPDPVDFTNYLRASAWYYVGYKRDSMMFAWLGARYLNDLKASNLSAASPIPLPDPRHQTPTRPSFLSLLTRIITVVTMVSIVCWFLQ